MTSHENAVQLVRIEAFCKNRSIFRMFFTENIAAVYMFQYSCFKMCVLWENKFKRGLDIGLRGNASGITQPSPTGRQLAEEARYQS